MIIVVGPPGSWAREAATHLDLEVIDTEKVIEERHGAPMSELILMRNVRDEERQVALEALASDGDVVVLGSGVLGNRVGDAPELERALDEAIDAGAIKVFLDADPRVLMNRCGMDVLRPASLGAPRAMFLSMLKERLPLYEKSAVRIDTSKMSESDIGQKLAEIAADLG